MHYTLVYEAEAVQAEDSEEAMQVSLVVEY
jgi:hypothetical protein